MAENNINITLSKNEALVFFEWLTALERMGSDIFQHPSEEKILWQIQGQLESTLQEPFADNYKDILASARSHVEHDQH